jgi:copper chaperone
MKKRLIIEGMSCNHCVMAVKKNLARFNPDKLDVKLGSADIEYNESKIKVEDLIKAIEEAGYKVVS